MLPDPRIKCPYTAFARTCREIVAECDCPKFVQVIGSNKNTGEPVNRMGCVDSLLHILEIETQSVMREVAGEVSMRGKEAREHAQQMASNLDAMNRNLITMHGQSTQIALAQVRALAQLPDARQAELPLIEAQSH